MSGPMSGETTVRELVRGCFAMIRLPWTLECFHLQGRSMMPTLRGGPGLCDSDLVVGLRPGRTVHLVPRAGDVVLLVDENGRMVKRLKDIVFEAPNDYATGNEASPLHRRGRPLRGWCWVEGDNALLSEELFPAMSHGSAFDLVVKVIERLAPDVPFGGGADPQSTHEACVDVSRVERVHESKSHGIFRPWRLPWCGLCGAAPGCELLPVCVEQNGEPDGAAPSSETPVILVHENDDAQTLAVQFCAEHGLHQDLVLPLAAHIIEKMTVAQATPPSPAFDRAPPAPPAPHGRAAARRTEAERQAEA
ncbi:Mitochondrial inner membrane protease subunit 2 [Durusdinium trenchii]|uniref:Mitochondrial inner membrane protease subunit 2 n=1 Tax=Durusdinium trenchii TaxID=1381693 RepID=A0ABP0L648_9DINO